MPGLEFCGGPTTKLITSKQNSFWPHFSINFEHTPRSILEVGLPELDGIPKNSLNLLSTSVLYCYFYCYRYRRCSKHCLKAMAHKHQSKCKVGTCRDVNFRLLRQRNWYRQRESLGGSNNNNNQLGLRQGTRRLLCSSSAFEESRVTEQ